MHMEKWRWRFRQSRTCSKSKYLLSSGSSKGYSTFQLKDLFCRLPQTSFHGPSAAAAAAADGNREGVGGGCGCSGGGGDDDDDELSIMMMMMIMKS